MKKLQRIRFLKALGLAKSIDYGYFCGVSRFSSKGMARKIPRENPDIVLISVPRCGVNYPPAGIAYLKSFV